MNEAKFLPAEEFLKQKRNILFSRVTLFGAGVALLITFQDFYEGLRAAPIIDFLFALILLGNYWLNRIGYHRTAKIATLILLNFGFAIYASMLPWEIGVFLFYFPVLAMTFGFFGPNEKVIRNNFVTLSFALILALFIFNFNLTGSLKIEATNPGLSMIINLMASLFVCIMCIQFMISINEEAEKKLVQLADEVNIKNRNLKKTNEELDRFVYSASHDLRAPLMSVKGLVSLAEKETTDERLQEYLGMIHGQTEKLDHFIKDIISYSRNGRTEVVWESINLSDLINTCIDNLKFMPDADRINLIQEFDAKEVFVLDKSRMEIILNNIISNTFKYKDLTKDKCWVKIQASKNLQQIVIQIKDNGVGIPLDRQAKIFDMFYRATEESHGSGIGLYIAKEAAEKMGGTIAVESTYGQGTTFTISIPVHTDNPASDHQ